MLDDALLLFLLLHCQLLNELLLLLLSPVVAPGQTFVGPDGPVVAPVGLPVIVGCLIATSIILQYLSFFSFLGLMATSQTCCLLSPANCAGG